MCGKTLEYGLIGEKLPHSYSVEIHNNLADYDYKLCELTPEEVGEFMTDRKFSGINVTIPYKKTVMPYLDVISDKARKIGAVNTVVNRDGKLYGFNTDHVGLTSLIAKAGIEIHGKNCLVLGTGGTSQTAKAVLSDLGALKITVVSRKKAPDTVTYAKAETMTETEVIVNTTPVGMYPNENASPIDIGKFPKLCGVVDAIYNPLRTELVLDAKRHGIPAVGGLYMLVAQGAAASSLFLGGDGTFNTDDAERICEKVRTQKENIVLVGMPSCGKSAIGKKLSQMLDRPFCDTDELFEKRFGITPCDYINGYGERSFRDTESMIVSECAAMSCGVIATGGGAVLRPQNVRALLRNGRIYFIDRDLSALKPSPDRPLSHDRETLGKMFHARYPLYKDVSDVTVDGNMSVDEVAKAIRKEFCQSTEE